MMITACKTDIGRIRSVNEDSAAIHSANDGLTVAVVADGMGGHQAGDVASRTTTEAVLRKLRELRREMTPREWEESVVRAVRYANAEVYGMAALKASYAGMGTTLVLAVAIDSRLLIAHVGDSRAYLFRAGRLTLLTDDHSLVHELLRAGEIAAEEARSHPRRNVLTRALGTEQTIEADIRHIDWEPGDLLLLCSDGLNNMLPDDEIRRVLAADESTERKAERLIEQALSAGGDDNVTAVIVENERSSGTNGG